jgi:hypothetical protein
MSGSIIIVHWLLLKTMKKIVFLIAAVAVLACNKPHTLTTYRSVIKRERLSVDGYVGYNNKIDTLMALNDTLAYKKGLTRFYNNLVDEAHTPNRRYVTRSFKVINEANIDISSILSKNIKDSLDKIAEKAARGQLKK